MATQPIHDDRFIPACAGNASRNASVGSHQFGSSPRVRGTPETMTTQPTVSRFIPACAGNAAELSGAQRPTAVHPRVCGERFHDARHEATTRRFIPACAGNAKRMCIGARVPTVHPRVCGERMSPDTRSVMYAGSSPRVRGTRFFGRAANPVMRFIPACAGNACAARTSIRHLPVHPRVCGERAARPCRSAAASRFIPACAGNAQTRISRIDMPTVHPRVCGVLAPVGN